MKFKSFHYVLTFFIASYLYSNFLCGELLLSRYGSAIVLPLMLVNFLIPFVYLALTPLLERARRYRLNHLSIKERSTPLYFLIKILLTVYILFSLMIGLFDSTNKIITYYFTYLPISLYFVTIIGLVLYALKNRQALLHLLSNLFLYFILVFILLYLLGYQGTDFSGVFDRSFDMNSLFSGFVLLLIMLLEPFLFFTFGDLASTRYKKRQLFFILLIGAFFSNYLILREVGEFGSLLTLIHSPFFESMQLFTIGGMPSDLLGLFYGLGLTFLRILFLSYLFLKIWNLKHPFIVMVLLFLCASSAWLFLQNMEVFLDLIQHLYIIAAFSLLGYSILMTIFVAKGRTGGDKKDVSTI